MRKLTEEEKATMYSFQEDISYMERSDNMNKYLQKRITLRHALEVMGGFDNIITVTLRGSDSYYTPTKIEQIEHLLDNLCWQKPVFYPENEVLFFVQD